MLKAIAFYLNNSIISYTQRPLLNRSLICLTTASSLCFLLETAVFLLNSCIMSKDWAFCWPRLRKNLMKSERLWQFYLSSVSNYVFMRVEDVMLYVPILLCLLKRGPAFQQTDEMRKLLIQYSIVFLSHDKHRRQQHNNTIPYLCSSSTKTAMP